MPADETQDSPYNDMGYFKDGLRGKVLAGVPPGRYTIEAVLPPGILVVENFLSPGPCKVLMDYADTQASVPSTVQSPGASAGELRSQRTDQRVTDYIDIQGIEDQVTKIVADAYGKFIEPHYSVALEWHEYPEILRYKPGGYYTPHADADNWDNTHQSWSRVINRDLSVLVYLNDNFTGGALEFPNFGFRLQPKAGMMVCFPSDHRYVHSAKPTTEGTRYVLVSWCAILGGERVTCERPARAITV